MNAKSIWNSKTLYINLVGSAIVILTQLADVAPAWQPYLAAGLALLNIINRFLTTVPVTLK